MGASVRTRACPVKRERSKGEMFWPLTPRLNVLCFDSLNAGGLRLSNGDRTGQTAVRQRTSQ